MAETVAVLDQGYCSLVETWGSDERIIESARMSTDKGFQGWGPTPCPAMHNAPNNSVTVHLLAGWLGGGQGDEHDTTAPCRMCKGTGFIAGDEKLMNYLWENKHATPFEMAGMTIEVQAPLFVFREWHRHRTQSYNELSARYTTLPDMFYVPSLDRLLNGAQSTTNKQSSTGGVEITQAEIWRDDIRQQQRIARDAYDAFIKTGMAKELARLVIPVSQYSRMRASANLRNWLAFLTLRNHPAAQWEIRQYAQVVAGFVRDAFPRTWEVFIS